MTAKAKLRRIAVHLYDQDVEDAKQLINGPYSKVVRELFHRYMEQRRRQLKEKTDTLNLEFTNDQ